jgi:hypothetical protein
MAVHTYNPVPALEGGDKCMAGAGLTDSERQLSHITKRCCSRGAPEVPLAFTGNAHTCMHTWTHNVLGFSRGTKLKEFIYIIYIYYIYI